MPDMKDARSELLQGTLDLLILRTLTAGADARLGHLAAHPAGVAAACCVVNQGSLYPALYRLEEEGWIASEWGASENNRRAKFYRLTRAGEQQLARETAELAAARDRGRSACWRPPSHEALARKLWFRLQSLRSRPRLESELDAELRLHLELETEKNRRAGMSPDEARRAARISLRRRRPGQGAGPRRVGRGRARGTACRTSATVCAACARPRLHGRRGADARARDRRQHRDLQRRERRAAAAAALRRAASGWWWCARRSTQPGDAEPGLLRAGAPRLSRLAAAALESLVEYHTMSFTLLGNREAERVQTGVVSPEFFDVAGRDADARPHASVPTTTSPAPRRCWC